MPEPTLDPEPAPEPGSVPDPVPDPWFGASPGTEMSSGALGGGAGWGAGAAGPGAAAGVCPAPAFSESAGGAAQDPSHNGSNRQKAADAVVRALPPCLLVMTAPHFLLRYVR